MRSARDLEDLLADIDRRGYPAYKRVAGAYDLGGGLTLSVDHVQGDPFAAPSSLSVSVPLEVTGFPAELVETRWRRVAFEDFLLRRLGRALARHSHEVGGSGKSGLLATSRPVPEVLERSASEVTDGTVTLRFEAGFPAHGRTADARGLARMLLDLVPLCAEQSLLADDDALAEARERMELADDQHFVRAELERLGLVAFVADGSVLPRATGVSAAPLAGATPFTAPESMRVALDLPHRGPTSGMAVHRGVTLIVGGGYHGKSTLLKALQEGVYDHVPGDGRELVVTDAGAVKLRAEDGRPVRSCDISLFIGELPGGQDTRRFSTLDASGSTSQAAATVEAIQEGSRALLIDEDTSATNFMVRDRLMEAVVSREHEPITPFVERVRDLWEQAGVSSVIVAGSSGAFFSVADAVVQMDRYVAHDITDHARAVCRELGAPETPRAQGFALPDEAAPCHLAAGSAHGERTGRGSGRGAWRGRPGHDRQADLGPKARSFGRDSVQVGEGSADLRLVEQVVDSEQVSAIAQLVRLGFKEGVLPSDASAPEVARALLGRVRARGWDVLSPNGHAGCGLALPRLHELVAALERWREGRGQ